MHLIVATVKKIGRGIVVGVEELLDNIPDMREKAER
jgi:hypothetical protein